ncbi:MAG: hypothetical protein Q9195_000435 [Heterodermia aff. obscurata]
MAQDLSDIYSKHMRHHGCGEALYQPIAYMDIEPPCCGYFDQNDKWNLIARLKNEGKPNVEGLTSLRRPPVHMRSIGLRWQPKCSIGVRMSTVDISGKTPFLNSDVGIPMGANAHVKYQSKKSFGAVLIARNPVEVTAYNDECLFKEWLEENKPQLYSRFGHQLKKYGLWIVTVKYTAPGCSINAWMDKDKDAVLSAKAKAAMVGDLGAELDWTDKITDKDRCHYTAIPYGNAVEGGPAVVYPAAEAVNSVGRRLLSKARIPLPDASIIDPQPMVNTAPRRHTSNLAAYRPDVRPERIISRKPAISPVGNRIKISTLHSQANPDLDLKSSIVRGTELNPLASIAEESNHLLSRAATRMKPNLLKSSPEQAVSEGVVMFYDGLYANPLDWWLEGTRIAFSPFGSRRLQHAKKVGKIEEHILLRNGSNQYQQSARPQLLPDSDETYETRQDMVPHHGYGQYDESDSGYHPDRDEGEFLPEHSRRAMSLTSRIANIFNTSPSPHLAPHDETRRFGVFGSGEYGAIEDPQTEMDRRKLLVETVEEEEEARPPYLHSMLAGGIGGTTGDLLMHSIDTVKTRQQGDPHIPSKYTSLSSTYSKIFRQEGVRRGLYGGVTPAFLGSFPGTIIFFGVYEFSKRHMIDAGMNHSLAYLAGGFIADLAASVVYVPSEVLKTRLQLQGRYNNPFFKSGYNYRSTLDATKTIARQEGVSALFYGYKATIWRDLPFSALQFAFYEQERKLAMKWAGGSDIGLPLEIATAATAGGMAGVITCPLDVVKTRIQTQINPPEAAPVVPAMKSSNLQRQPARGSPVSSAAYTSASMHASPPKRTISTSSPSTTVPKSGSVPLDTSSMVTGLKSIYKTEGIAGCFRGVGPRFVWTSVQSSTMLVLYQVLLKHMKAYQLSIDEGNNIA